MCKIVFVVCFKFIFLLSIPLTSLAGVPTWDSLSYGGSVEAQVEKIESDRLKSNSSYGRAKIIFVKPINKDEIVRWSITNGAIIDGLETNLQVGDQIFLVEMNTLASEPHLINERVTSAENQHRTFLGGAAGGMLNRANVNENLEKSKMLKEAAKEEIFYNSATVYLKLEKLLELHVSPDIKGIIYYGPISEEGVIKRQQQKPLEELLGTKLNTTSLWCPARIEDTLLYAEDINDPNSSKFQV
ncbi:hypothetical protein ACJJID_07125 [Microbulbifer sp. CnH-101-G]|uniref:hypothetical protein n=1 Tax=Microbulbifer sp. CnH-101-G TaxID=3243393 RepID=UPI0040392060